MSSMRTLLWTALRVAVGLGLATHGWGKIFGHTPEGASKMVGHIALVTSLGFPKPVYWAWASAITELVGGAFVALGFFTRPAAFLAAINMGVAVYAAREGGFSHWETPVLYLAGMLAIFAEGAGPISIDAMLSGSSRGRPGLR